MLAQVAAKFGDLRPRLDSKEIKQLNEMEIISLLERRNAELKRNVSPYYC